MSFLSYLTRIPRHFDSHANVRSTTQRRGFSPFDLSQDFFSSPIRRMWGMYQASVAAFSPRVVERLIQAQVLRLLFSRLGPVDDDRVDRRLQELLLHDVGPGGHDAQRAAVAVGQEVLLGPFLAAVGGVLAHLFPPNRALPSIASADCHSHCTPPSSSHSAARTAQIRSMNPACGPPLEPVVDGALGPESLGQLVPLAAAAHPEDDRVEHLPPVGNPAAGRLLGPEVQEDRLDPPPQVIGDFPDRPQRFASGFGAGHE